MIKAVEHVMEEKWVDVWREMGADARAKARRHTTTKGRERDAARRSNQPFTLDAWLSKHYPQVNFVR